MVTRGGSAQAEELEGMGKAELLKTLTFGMDSVVAAGCMPTDEELDKIIDRTTTTKSSTETYAIGRSQNSAAAGDGGEGASVRQNAEDFEMVAPQSLRTFEGMEYTAKGASGESSASAVPLELRKLDVQTGAQLQVQDAGAGGSASGAADGGGDGDGGGGSGIGSMADIAREWQEKTKRSRTSRFMEVTDESGVTHRVLKLNNYDLESGESSVFTTELSAGGGSGGGGGGGGVKRKRGGKAKRGSGLGRQIAGRDYVHQDLCMNCWDGGALVCCDICPASYHPACVGLSKQQAAGGRSV